jgi:hypothetical protein
MGIVDYLAQEGFLGDDFNRLLSDCALQGDLEALQIFLKYQRGYFTVGSSLLIFSHSVSNPNRPL